MAELKSKYIAIQEFTDLQDNKHKYLVGDEFPRKGLVVSESRLDELLTNKNRRGYPMIEKAVAPEDKSEAIIEKTELIKEEAEIEVEKPKSAAPTKRGRKK